MNNTFNLKRFVLLFKKHSIENAKTDLLSVCVLTGLLVLVLGFASLSGNKDLPNKVQGVVFTFGFLIVGSIFTSLSFADLGDKKKAINILTLPASHFEKFLVQWIYSFIIFQLVFVGAFFLVDWIIITTLIPDKPIHNELLDLLDKNAIQYYSFLFYALFNAFTLWGSVFFQKLHFIKTTVVFFIVVAIFILINTPFLRILINDNTAGIPFGAIYSRTIFTPGQYWHIAPTDTMINTHIAVLSITILILWATTYYCLKEKEV